MKRITMHKRINLAATEGLLAQIHLAAEKAGMTPAEFMRDAIRRRIEQVVRKQRHAN